VVTMACTNRYCSIEKCGSRRSVPESDKVLQMYGRRHFVSSESVAPRKTQRNQSHA
jgi:hypothetical protein